MENICFFFFLSTHIVSSFTLQTFSSATWEPPHRGDRYPHMLNDAEPNIN